MSYENNRIKYFLERNALLKANSKSTPSVYYYFKYYSVRYSNHFTQDKPIPKQLQVIKKANEVWILTPEEVDYKRFNEKTGFYFLRKYLKGEKHKKKIFKETRYIKFMKQKQLHIEERKIKSFLKDLKFLCMKNLTSIDYA
jgi:hypothetical protein